MGNARAVFRVCLHDLKKLLVNPRTYLLLPLTFIIVHYASRDVRSLCTEFSVTASPLPLFTGITVTTTMQSLLLVCWLILICDAPFIDDTQPYILLRCGRYTWSAGQVLYLFTASILFWLWVGVCCCIVLIPHFSPTVDWGQVYHSLTYYPSYSFLSSRVVVASYSALRAFGISFALSMALCIFFAEIVYLVNLLTGKMYGVFIPVALIFVNWAYYVWEYSPIPLRASPASLASLHWIDATAKDIFMPTLTYSAAFFAVSIALLAALCIVSIRRRPIHIQQPI